VVNATLLKLYPRTQRTGDWLALEQPCEGIERRKFLTATGVRTPDHPARIQFLSLPLWTVQFPNYCYNANKLTLWQQCVCVCVCAMSLYNDIRSCDCGRTWKAK